MNETRNRELYIFEDVLHYNERFYNMRKFLLLLTVLLSISRANATDCDTTMCRQIVLDFYDWYSGKIMTDNVSDFQPKFAEDKNGYVTLDFTAYVENLKRLRFTDKLIKQEIAYYNPCVENLKKIKYCDFKTKLSDISDFENIKCDFFNIHRWVNTMESFTGVELSKSIFRKDKVQVFGRVYEKTPDETYYYGDVIITLLKIDNKWMINDIEI
jgi:hypothetical protein